MTFPQTELYPELHTDHHAIRAFVAAGSELGFDHITAYEHVLGVDPRHYPGGPPSSAVGKTVTTWPYTHETPFTEPMTLFSFLAALTDMELVTGIIVLPQRQTALVAKQAATLDLLSGGNLRFGIGTGWNPVEYAAMGQSWETRGQRMDEQIDLLRQLWTEEVVTFEGKHDTVQGAGILPLPVQRPIPIWMGSLPKGPALRRVGRKADGWISLVPPGDDFDRAWDELRSVAVKAGRNPEDIGLEGRVDFGDGNLDRIASAAAAWRERGATHLTLNTVEAGLTSVDAHLRALEAMRNALQP